MAGRVNQFLLGCDPEFAVSQDGRLVNNNGTFRNDGPVGWDHGGWVLECRPEPAYFARTLVRRMGRLLRDPRVQGLPKVRAGAYYRAPERTVTLGGHVHLDINPVNPLGQFTPDHLNRSGALDRLTQQLEHLDILPRGESEARRATGQYGRYGDVRVQGDPPRTEYRTMGSWLLSPSVAMLCLTGAKLAACDPEGVPGTMVDYDGLKDWFGKYKEDRDVEFVQNYILTKPLKHLQVDPDSDFRSKWERVGVEEQHGKR